MSKCVFCGRSEEQINQEEGAYLIRGSYLYKDFQLPFVFSYDQNEGKQSLPEYISCYKVDVCKKCLIQGSGFFGYGALGTNRYSIGVNGEFWSELHEKAEKIASDNIAKKENEISALKNRLQYVHNHPIKNLLRCLIPPLLRGNDDELY